MDTVEKNQSGDRQAEIIRISTDLFLKNGFSGTSMSKIANACDITKASLYHHFSGKEDLFIACVTDGYKEALVALEEILADTSQSPETQLRLALDTLYSTIVGSPVGQMSPLIAEVSRAFPSVARSFHSDYIEPQEALMWQLIDRGIDQGAFKDVDKKVLSHLIFGPIVTLSMSREMFASFEDLDDHFPISHLQNGHAKIILGLLEAD
ncbi:TetR/AcrR family transcriptional regulator [Pseudaestuariivita rosea]|uniref:TetR/AcrR family transcriptional regulator n=1 Tax=Pseudaestuariivita rosea TaxID=2763263 RepID=UPI001ABB70D1|nr:TetR/AcrR family transcriptional regulator [Pseudaestuariivita rosea]